MRYQPIKLDNGWTIQPEDNGEPGMCFDQHGNPRTFNELPIRMRQQYSVVFGQEADATEHFEALAAKDDAGFEEISDWISRNASPEELRLIQTDAAAFKEAYRIAREAIGPTVAEYEAEEARQDRRVELTQLLRAGQAGASDIGELLDLGGIVPAEDLPDADEE